MATGIDAWERLTAIATLGTRRGAATDAAAWPDATLAAAAATDAPEKTLLRAAAATLVWRLAGRRIAAESGLPSLPPMPGIERTALASEAASMRLVRMIGGDRRELIGEWFALAQAGGKSLAPQFLPLVLDGVHPKLRNEYPRVLGPAATWLAHLNRDWTVTAAVEEPSERRWHEGTLEERRAELICMRRHDAARARDWLSSTWATDPPEAREAFLKVLQIGLSTEDEAFLEAALDDKRKGVRQAAVEALARLPQSAHARRNEARLTPLLALEEKSNGLLAMLSKRKLIIQLPTSIDKAAQRDGIDLKPPAQRKIGERAFWLVQMVALVAPRHWNERFGCDAATFIAAAMNTDHALELLSALSEAAARHADAEWLSALCDAWLDSKQEQHVIVQAISRLIGAVPPAARGPLFESQAQEVAKRNLDAFLFLIDNIDLTWTPAISELAIEHIAARARTERQTWAHARNALDSWGRRCDVATAMRLLPGAVAAAGDDSPWRNALEQLSDTIEFRAAMQRELK